MTYRIRRTRHNLTLFGHSGRYLVCTDVGCRYVRRSWWWAKPLIHKGGKPRAHKG